MTNRLLSPARLGALTLSNHLVMAPMTRSRATGNVPNHLMAQYYAQRADAGLIITEGTSPSPDGLGYARIPGLYNKEQIEGWKKVTGAVHEKGGKIFVQLMHTGRIAHPLNLPEGARIAAPSAVAASGSMWTDQQGMQPHPVPHALTTAEVQEAVQEYVQAAVNAIEAGFDGVELHGANGYLIEQFLAPNANQRTDQYGGSIENRSRFLLEIAGQTAAAISRERVGVRLSPYGVFNDIALHDQIDETYAYIARQLDALGIVYLHLVDHSSQGAPPVSPGLVSDIRRLFRNTLILSGGYDQERAEKDLLSGMADLVAFGKPFISNPDLPERFRTGEALTPYDPDTFYSPGEKGYTDYPAVLVQTA